MQVDVDVDVSRTDQFISYHYCFLGLNNNLHTFVDKANFISLLGGVALFRSFWTKTT